jgi:hypothetical protein
MYQKEREVTIMNTTMMENVKAELQNVAHIDEAIIKLEDIVSDTTIESMKSDAMESAEYVEYVLGKLKESFIEDTVKAGKEYIAGEYHEYSIMGRNSDAVYDTIIESEDFIQELETIGILAVSDNEIFAK